MTTIIRANVGGSDGYRDVALDKTSRALVVIQNDHRQIHEGVSFAAHNAQEVTDIGKRSAITFQTPDTAKWAHMVVTVQSTDETVALLLEDLVIDSGSAGEPAALTAFNRNRNSLITSGVISQHATPTTGDVSVWTEALLQDAGAGDADWAVTTETELARIALGAAINPAKSFGGVSRGTQEYILKQNTVYMILMTSGTANDNIMQITLDWYETISKT